jgi:hypothetical protein
MFTGRGRIGFGLCRLTGGLLGRKIENGQIAARAGAVRV